MEEDVIVASSKQPPWRSGVESDDVAQSRQLGNFLLGQDAFKEEAITIADVAELQVEHAAKMIKAIDTSATLE